MARPAAMPHQRRLLQQLLRGLCRRRSSVNVTTITPQLIRGLITHNGRLFVPADITDAIESCLESSADAIRYEGARLQGLYQQAQTTRRPVTVDYSGAATVDAYSVYYLPRNTLVPKVAILCCAHSPALQTLPDRLSVLDLGSGTGGVVLGLIDLFSNQPLTGIHLDIVALDASSASLDRQNELVDRIGCGHVSHRSKCVELSDPVSFRDALSLGAPYDMVFAANLFGEMHESPTLALIQSVAHLLAANGIMVSVESQSNHVMEQRVRIVRTAKQFGLHTYYPCPPTMSCPGPSCWMWRTDEFDCPSITVDGEEVETTTVHKAHWTVLCRKPCTIYDAFRSKNPRLTWGVAHIRESRVEGDEVKHDYTFCTQIGRLKGTITQDRKKWMWSPRTKLFDRGTVIGMTGGCTQIAEGWDIVSGYLTY